MQWETERVILIFKMCLFIVYILLRLLFLDTLRQMGCIKHGMILWTPNVALQRKQKRALENQIHKRCYYNWWKSLTQNHSDEVLTISAITYNTVSFTSFHLTGKNNKHDTMTTGHGQTDSMSIYCVYATLKNVKIFFCTPSIACTIVVLHTLR